MTPEHKVLVARLRNGAEYLEEGPGGWPSAYKDAASAIESLSAQSAQPQAGEEAAFRAGFTAGEAAGKFDDDKVNDAWSRYSANLVASQPADPSQVMDALKSAEKALRPYYNAVFNDNGDMAVSGPYGHEEAIAGYFAHKKVERALAAIGAGGQAAASAKPEPDFAASIAEVIKEESAGGAACGWKSCSGCHETSEGAETGHYPYSKMFGCYVGSGCSECGGLGVVWEHWSDDALKMMAADVSGSAHPASSGQAVAECTKFNAVGRKCVGGECDWHRAYIVMESTLRESQDRCRKLQEELDALSQPHPADERVVEAAREIAARAYIAVGNPAVAKLTRAGSADHMPGFIAALEALRNPLTGGRP